MSSDPAGGVRRGPFRFTRGRVLSAVAVVAVLLVGVFPPYLTLGYQDFAGQPVRPTLTLWPSSQLVSVLNLAYVPDAPGTSQDVLQRGVDLLSLGLSAHQIGLVAVVATIWGLFMDEVNKFLWWPLHLAGWALVLGTGAVWAGFWTWRSAGVDVVLGPGWLPFPIAGVAVIVVTLRAWSRIDTYAGA